MLTSAERPDTAKSSPGMDAAVEQAKKRGSFKWADLESEDYREYILRLREFGVPESTIRDLIIAEIGKLYRPKFAALRSGKKSSQNFWERGPSGLGFSNQTPEQRRQTNALRKEQQELVKSLLGSDVYREIAKAIGNPDWSERLYGALPEDLRAKVSEMQERFQEANNEIYARAAGIIDQETQQDLLKARQKFHDELSKVLTPEQLQEYELRNSETAHQMRSQLSSFQPNENEFRAIFAYKQGLEAAGVDTAFSRQDLSGDKYKDLQEALAQSLGPDRLKEYKLTEQWEFRNLIDNGVPRDDILKLVDLKDANQAATAAVRQNASLDDAQKRQALADIRAESEKGVLDLLGDRRGKAYMLNGGFWVRNPGSAMRLQNVLPTGK